ncbi:DNA/RNA helicase, ATP-dependent, DEAH-box type, conserved site-containing protein [Cynara cardunculus var. scolymus]|uniref:RNA helicase n=1 Tax=Cynara cardunculus var. scolymus TaxID=59895 RepID=A0A103XTH6_CYNCS|nr:DNA/RNA helicase, ATP-dependent, DEAH-box type, conserved site-containing protein [Cynara cardunculus var. scolymus]
MPSMATGDANNNSNINHPQIRPKLVNGSHKSDRRQKIEQQRRSLPIASVEKRLVEEVRKNDILIIVGETGSGKTTPWPGTRESGFSIAGFCRDGGTIGITQPRRVAAVTVAKRVAEECGVELGQKVGYSIRFEDMTSISTRIKYMTDGLLLSHFEFLEPHQLLLVIAKFMLRKAAYAHREALLDPYLSRYSVIIVDEAHERTVQTDVLLGLLKGVQKKRSQSSNNDHVKANNGTLMKEENNGQAPHLGRRLNPLKLIIMSASLDARGFSEYFGGAKAVHVQGRQFPVDILYTAQPETDCLDAALVSIFQIHLEEGPGDILVFLSGQEEIESIEGLVRENLKKLPEACQKLLILPLFSSLPSEKQLKVFTPAPVEFRKVILATNIAETSVTIPGIKYVIDPGLVKVRSYSPDSGIESLIVVKTSKAQALQRSALGVDDIIGFDFMEKPDRMAVIRSLELLYLLGALTDEKKLSDPIGHQMARLPLEPNDSKALILASQFDCLEEMLIVVAMLSVESIFYAPREKLEESRTVIKSFSSPEGDHLTLLNVYRASLEFLEKNKTENGKEKAEKNLRKWCKDNFINSRSLKHARDIYNQIRENVERMGLKIASCGDDTFQLRRCLAASYFLNAALKQPDGTYRVLANGQIAEIHPTSVLRRTKSECIIFYNLVQTTRNYVRNVTRIDYLWLAELAPQCYALKE